LFKNLNLAGILYKNVEIYFIIIKSLTLSTNKTYRISLPPNLEFGATINTGEIDHFEIALIDLSVSINSSLVSILSP
jgi:hypothetical protein